MKSRYGNEEVNGSWKHSQWLRQKDLRLGVPCVPARPWDTVLERVMAVVDVPCEIGQEEKIEQGAGAWQVHRSNLRAFDQDYAGLSCLATDNLCLPILR